MLKRDAHRRAAPAPSRLSEVPGMAQAAALLGLTGSDGPDPVAVTPSMVVAAQRVRLEREREREREQLPQMPRNPSPLLTATCRLCASCQEQRERIGRDGGGDHPLPPGREVGLGRERALTAEVERLQARIVDLEAKVTQQSRQRHRHRPSLG